MFGSQESAESSQNLFGTLVHADRKDFGAERITIAIDHQTWKSIRLGMDHPVGVGESIELQEFFSERDGSLEQSIDEGIVRGLSPPAHSANGDLGPIIEHAVAKNLRRGVPLGGIKRDPISGFRAPFDAIDAFAINRRVKHGPRYKDRSDRIFT